MATKMRDDLTKLKAFTAEAEKELDQLIDKNKKISSTRARSYLQKIRNMSQEIRNDILVYRTTLSKNPRNLLSGEKAKKVILKHNKLALEKAKKELDEEKKEASEKPPAKATSEKPKRRGRPKKADGDIITRKYSPEPKK